MNLNKILTNLDKLLNLKIDSSKSNIDFKNGEIIKGEVIKFTDTHLLVDIGERGVVTALTDFKIPIANQNLKNILLKVVNTQPNVILQLVNPKEGLNQEKIADNISEDRNKLNTIIDRFPQLKDSIFIDKKDFENIELLKDKIKNLPDKLGFTFENNLSKEVVDKENLKYKLIENDSNSSKGSDLQTVENFQKFNDQFQLFLPLFFKDSDIDKGSILYKDVSQNSKEGKAFTVLILLNMTDDRVIQISIIAINKDISLNITSNNQRFLDIIKNGIEELNENITQLGFKVISISFNISDKINNEDVLKSTIKNDRNINIIDIKT